MRLAAGAWLLSALACGSAADPEPDVSPDVGAAPAEGAAWHDHGVWPVNAAGLTGEVIVDLPAGSRSLLVRVRPGPDAPLPSSVCFAIGGVVAPDGTVWSEGPIRSEGTEARSDEDAAADQPGYALGLWPRVGQPPLPAGEWRVRGALVACGAQTPVAPPGAALQVETVALPAVSGPMTLGVRRVYAPEVDEAQRQAWDPVFEHASEVFAGAGIEVVEEPPLLLSPPAPGLAPLRVGVGLGEVDTLAAVVEAHEPQGPAAADVGVGAPALVVVVPCIDRVDPAGGQTRLLGHATRLPGGPRLAGWASFVVVGTSDCGAPSPRDAEGLGRVLAHELGHLLGLPHAAPPSVMTPGPDTLSERPRFTDAEAVALRASPLVIGP